MRTIFGNFISIIKNFKASVANGAFFVNHVFKPSVIVVLAVCVIVTQCPQIVNASWSADEPAGTQNASDIDTLVIANNEAVEDALEDMRGWKNLKVVRDSVTQVTVTANELWLQYSGDLPRNFTTVSETIAITTSGASGLDTGTESADAWYYIWIIAKADNTINGLLSDSSTAPTLPSGYVYKTLVSAVHNTSGDFVDFTQNGRKYCYASWLALATGAFGTYGTAWGSLDVTAYVPSDISSFAFGSMHSSSGGTVFMTNDSSIDKVAQTDVRNKFMISGSQAIPWALDILTSNTLYGQGYDSGCTIYIAGFELNKLS